MASTEGDGHSKALAKMDSSPEAPKANSKSYDADEHLLKPAQVAERFGTQVDLKVMANSPGLSADQVAEQRAKHGLNQLTPPPQVPEIIKYLKQFLNPLMMLLLVAGGLCYMAYALQPADTKDKNNIILATALILVVILTCTMSWWQERSASSVMASLSKMMPAKTLIIRGGKETRVEAVELVPGDLVRLALGDRVPADVRLLESADLKVECSSLTGESDLVPGTVEAKSDLVEHAHNVVFMSSLVMNGEGRGIVIRTGDHTYIGSIASLAGSSGSHTSTLAVEVHRLIKFVAIIAFSTAIAFFSIGLGRDNVSRIDAFINGFILVIVANVPEGLPATVTSLLTLTAMRLKERNVLIKKTDIIENLGCASIIASDKTGTLTQNKMTVQHLWVDSELHEATAIQPAPGAAAVGAGGDGLGRLSERRGLGRTTLNRASRRILDKVSQSRAGMGTSLATTSMALGQNPMPEIQPQLGPAASSTVEMTLAGSPAGTSPSKQVISSGGHGAHVPDTTLAITIPELTPAATAPNTLLGRMSIGRASIGFTSMGRMKTRALGVPSVSMGTLTPSGSVHGGLAALDSLRMERAGTGVRASPMEVADFSQMGRVSWGASSALTRLCVCAVVCNKARFTSGDAEEDKEGGHVAVAVSPFGTKSWDRPVVGDATDTGLLRFVERLAPSDAVRNLYKGVFSIPFNSANKVLMKGAPEMIIQRCTSFSHRGVEMAVDDAFRASLMRAYERCGFLGERVIGLAYKSIPARTAEVYAAQVEAGDGEDTITSGLTFAGLMSLVDPPRPSVPDAVSRCRRAGIRVAMVTGDHPLTAEAIARKVGIITLKTQREVAADLGIPEDQVPWDHPQVGAVVVAGGMLRELRDDDLKSWDAMLDHEEVVFARTTPAQKLQIVEHLQRRGEVVAVTGDGVNDSPALAKAQIGVAMGLGGSDVAREAADIVLLDDEFGSIVAAVEEGRVIYDNLKKTIAYTLTHALPELIPIFLNLALSFPLGLGGLLILSIDLVTEQGPAISLAYEKAEANVMERLPRDTDGERLVDGRVLRYAYLIAGVLESGICLLCFFSIFWWHGVPATSVGFGLDKGYFNVDTGASTLLKTTITCTPSPTDALCSADGYKLLDGEGQLDVWYEAQAGWYVTLVMCQFWHIFLCKTRQVSLFKHGITHNPVTFYGLIISVAVVIGIVYIPGLHNIFATRSLSGIGWLPNLLFLAIMLPFTEYCKWCVRRHPEGRIARYIQW